MNVDEAKRRVENIAAQAGDAEGAHSSEDMLYSDFVRFVATQEGDLAEVAKEILKTEKIDFPRWCA
jgi:hypothetical protein